MKYFPELGYFELYRCGAAAEREAGRNDELDRLAIRDLDDNRVYPGHWTRTYEGRCRAQFSKDRWAAFKRDLAGFRQLFTDRPVANSFADHGFNATPLNVVWLRLWTKRVVASPKALAWLARMDWVALAGALAFAYWGFGPVGCALAALVIAIGYPWNYHWVGGGIGRHTWLLCAWAGFALLKREKTLLGMILSFAFIAYGVVRGTNLWQTACLAGPLIFSALPSTSYDYIWLSLLVPIALTKPRRGIYLIAFAMWTQAMGIFETDIEVQHLWDSLGCLVLLVALSYDIVKDLRAKEPSVL